MRILINTISTKKHSGGAFQISSNFMLKSLEHKDVEWYYVASKDIDDAIGDKFKELRDVRYFVFPTQPDYKHTYRRVKKELSELEERINPNVIYSITAPSYFSFKHTEVMRFTNPLVTHPNKYSWSMLPWLEKLKTRLYCLNQIRLMKKACYFITQTETTKQGILRITGLPKENVKVVNNVLPAAFNGMDNSPIEDGDGINVACVGNPVPHKNFDIVPDVAAELKRMGVDGIRFHLTIPNGHVMEKVIHDKAVRLGVDECIVNHGRVTQKELGEMYRRCQFCFLPTLLEVFSASTVEAMYFNLPIVATDFPFNTEVLADSCLYYEPKNAKDAANQFAKLIADDKLQSAMRTKMVQRLKLFGNYDAHFNAIKAFLMEVAGKKRK